MSRARFQRATITGVNLRCTWAGIGVQRHADDRPSPADGRLGRRYRGKFHHFDLWDWNRFARRGGRRHLDQRFYQRTNWTAPGAAGDFVNAISGSGDVAATVDTPYVWPSTPTMVSDVQGWLDQPSTNDGWILINHTEGVQQTVKAFYSRDATEKNSVEEPLPSAWHPTLDITYTAAAISPTGDYNHNGVVDAADYVLWRNTLGQVPHLPEAEPTAIRTARSTPAITTFGERGFAMRLLGSEVSNLSRNPPPVSCLIAVTLANCGRRR